MPANFKNIHIGALIKQRMQECGIAIGRAAAFLKASEEDVECMYKKKSLDSDILLRWSKLLKYDFFRIYSQHLILYSPQDEGQAKRRKEKEIKTKLPVFKKNIYTQEVILYLVGLVESKKMTLKQLQDRYNIPSTTILRWYDKYGKK
ncbi:MAG: hypothetical protein ACK5KT_15415 [Dysgonomonas sp.]